MPLSKIHYRPIEAAVRWSGLAKHEHRILEALKERTIPEQGDFPKWPALRLNTQRIYDAIVNKELPYGIDGVTIQGKPSINDPRLTIRHVDLKAWMVRYYPDQKPAFLFSRIERSVHPTVTVDAVRALLVEREALKFKIKRQNREIHVLRAHCNLLMKKGDERKQSDVPSELLSSRSETAYLHIIGSLLTLLLGHAPSGQPYSSFRTQESVITALIAHHGERLGITKRTLETKFAAAKRALANH